MDNFLVYFFYSPTLTFWYFRLDSGGKKCNSVWSGKQWRFVGVCRQNECVMLWFAHNRNVADKINVLHVQRRADIFYLQENLSYTRDFVSTNKLLRYRGGFLLVQTSWIWWAWVQACSECCYKSWSVASPKRARGDWRWAGAVHAAAAYWLRHAQRCFQDRLQDLGEWAHCSFTTLYYCVMADQW